MKINTNLPNFKKRHINKKNQIIFHKAKCKSNKIIDSLINNFLIKKNSFIFESVEKRRIRGRYTIIGADPDKIWEFNKNKIHLINENKKKIIKGSPYNFLGKLIKNFDFPLPKNVPPNLKDILWEDYTIEVPIFEWKNKNYIRVSIHGYNDRSDIKKLIYALDKQLL